MDIGCSVSHAPGDQRTDTQSFYLQTLPFGTVLNIETKTKYHPLLRWLFIFLTGKRLFQNSFTAREEVLGKKLPSSQEGNLVCLPVCLCNPHSVKSYLYWSIMDWRKGHILNLLLIRDRLFPEVLMNLLEDSLFLCQECSRKWSMYLNPICQ